MQNLLEFNEEKATAAILYVAKNIDVSDKIRIAKVLYAADKYHLNRYFRFILGDVYARLPRGSAPSNVLDMLKSSSEAFEVRGYNIRPLQEPDMDELSPSDVEALDLAIEACKGKGWLALSKESHDAIYDANEHSHLISVDDFISHMENEETLREFLSD